jgi:hypothetical protein
MDDYRLFEVYFIYKKGNKKDNRIIITKVFVSNKEIDFYENTTVKTQKETFKFEKDKYDCYSINEYMQNEEDTSKKFYILYKKVEDGTFYPLRVYFSTEPLGLGYNSNVELNTIGKTLDSVINKFSDAFYLLKGGKKLTRKRPRKSNRNTRKILKY